MNDYEIKYLQKRIDSLEEKVQAQYGPKNFIWLFILSNLMFWVIIGHMSLRHGLDKVESKLATKDFKLCYQRENKNTKITDKKDNTTSRKKNGREQFN